MYSFLLDNTLSYKPLVIHIQATVEFILLELLFHTVTLYKKKTQETTKFASYVPNLSFF